MIFTKPDHESSFHADLSLFCPILLLDLGQGVINRAILYFGQIMGSNYVSRQPQKNEGCL